MVTARLAIGSVSTLALGALLLGSVPYWLARHGAGAHATPWGDVSTLGIAQPAAAASADDQAKLLKLAALKSTGASDAAVPSPSAAPTQPAARIDPAPPAAAVVETAPAPDQSAPAAVISAAPAPADAAPEPQQVASVSDPVSAGSANDDNAAKGDRININTASTSVLDHLPGVGRIGRTIVSHRPYRTVKDLVSRRVLRAGDFQKIQEHISVD